MGSIWGSKLKISLFGESHGHGIGVVIDGLPAGQAIDWPALQRFTCRRAPGRTPWSTPRREEDEAEILSGVYQDKTTGTPLAIVIRNTDTRSQDYESLRKRPRPGHADLTGMARYGGHQDPRGGGHFSGRVTAPLVFAGAICSQVLARKGIFTAAHLQEMGQIEDEKFDAVRPDIKRYKALGEKLLPVLDDAAGERMIEAVLAAKEKEDSVGGIIEVMTWGVPAGLGDPMFAGIEPRLSHLIYGIPAIIGLEFGTGFAAARRQGSTQNDAPYMDGTNIRFRTNNSGGIQGGITTGMPIVYRAAVKPTSSIGREQQTINLETMQNDTLRLEGRHDPCIAPRAVPVLEAANAVFFLDLLLQADSF